MNLTPEMRKHAKTAGAAVGLVIAIFFAYSAISGGPSPTGTSSSSPQTGQTGTLVDPTLKLALLNDAPYKGNGRNIFRMGEEPLPTPVAPARDRNGKLIVAAVGPTPVPTPYQPPPPPPINLKFYGYANKPGQPKKVFLSEGEDIFVGTEGDIVDRHYKILHIGNTSVDVEDLLNNNRQTLPLQS